MHKLLFFLFLLCSQIAFCQTKKDSLNNCVLRAKQALQTEIKKYSSIELDKISEGWCFESRVSCGSFNPFTTNITMIQDQNYGICRTGYLAADTLILQGRWLNEHIKPINTTDIIFYVFVINLADSMFFKQKLTSMEVILPMAKFSYEKHAMIKLDYYDPESKYSQTIHTENYIPYGKGHLYETAPLFAKKRINTAFKDIDILCKAMPKTEILLVKALYAEENNFTLDASNSYITAIRMASENEKQKYEYLYKMFLLKHGINFCE